MLVETERDSEASKRTSFNVEKQTLRVGAVAALLAFCMGLAFGFGGKSSSLDSLRTDVTTMSSKFDTLTKSVSDMDKSTSNQITHLEDRINEMQKTVDRMQNTMELQQQSGHR